MKLEYVFFCMMIAFRYRDRILSVYSEKEGKQNDYLNAPLLRSTHSRLSIRKSEIISQFVILRCRISAATA